MVLLVSDKDTLGNRGHRSNHIRKGEIEVLKISKKDGDILLNFLENALDNPTPERGYVQLKFTLDKENAGIEEENWKNNTVNIDFWLSSGDNLYHSYKILEDFRAIWEHFDGVKFNPRYVLWECDHCRRKGFKSVNNDQCLSGGRYCDPEPSREEVIGSEVVLEDLRQLCIFKQNEDLWWEYIIHFD